MVLLENLLLEMPWDHHSLLVLLFRVDVEQDLVIDSEKRCLESNLSGSLLTQWKFFLL